MKSAEERVRSYLRLRHPDIQYEDLEISDVPGYWRIKIPCDGKTGCRHPIHSCLFNEYPSCHTISFRDENHTLDGKFASPYRTWKELHDDWIRTKESSSGRK